MTTSEMKFPFLLYSIAVSCIAPTSLAEDAVALDVASCILYQTWGLARLIVAVGREPCFCEGTAQYRIVSDVVEASADSMKREVAVWVGGKGEDCREELVW